MARMARKIQGATRTPSPKRPPARGPSTGALDEPAAQAVENFRQCGDLHVGRFATVQPQPVAPLAPEPRCVNQLDLEGGACLLVREQKTKARGTLRHERKQKCTPELWPASFPIHAVRRGNQSH